MSLLWLALLGAPAALDTLVRVVLATQARRPTPPEAGEARCSLRWLVVVPARHEGPAVESTLRSLQAAAAGLAVRILVLLDGEDSESSRVCDELGVETLLKEPAGPSKGAALAWLVRAPAARLHEVDAVLLVDVGSRVAPDLFTALRWPPGVSGVQTRLTGAGNGTGAAVAHSERAAQDWEDRGRQALGWSVRLRGTGTALTPSALIWVAPRLRTRVEDLEASLLLAAAGERLALSGAEVVDDKPDRVGDAARQRARWLVGRVHLALRHPLAWLGLVARRPLEGLAFVVELASRPLSLTALLRLGVAVGLAIAAAHGRVGVGPTLAVAGTLVASVLGDVALLRLAGRLDWGAAAGLVAAWLGAVVLAPRAVWRWTRVKR